ncbi:Ig-like domain-containing protein [Chloroflexus sp.]|uniref:Ig-like domain-containing protein n=1 Tax=Chloroflexus sp. TaxID=1904827 RepID=UPI00257B6F8F|nr:Ig-like domain-containing protein [Chloroflexus sp.]
MKRFLIRFWVFLLIVTLLRVDQPMHVVQAAGFVVNSLADDTVDNDLCTLREAILTSNNIPPNDDCGPGSADDDVITFSVSGTIVLNTPMVNITSGQGALTIDGGRNIVISGNNLAIFTVAVGADLTLSNLTVTDGNATLGGAINNLGGTVNIINSTFSNNDASNLGGAIYNTGGIVTITSSTFTNNSSATLGGVIYNTGGTVTITNSTFSNNNAALLGGTIYNVSGTINLYNTIVANSGSSGDCVNLGTIGAAYNNLIEDSTNACGLINGVNGNIIGSDPDLGPLTGAPAYFPLNTGSPAIDNGSNAYCAATDQRGVLRPQDGDGNSSVVCDIGAYEVDIATRTVVNITRAGADPTNAATATFTVTFSEPVTGLDSADFSLTTTGSISGASVGSVSGSGASYTVTVATGSGDGSLRLDLNPSGTGITDSAGNAISGGFTGGESYTIDKTTPTVVNITRAGADPTNATTATFTVTFSEPVTGLDSADFSLTTTGSISGASVGSVSGSGASYTVTVATGSGDGSLRLDLNPSGTGITDSAGNAISGGFTGGESYTIDKTTPTVVSITRAEADPTNAATATFTVTFSEPVTGLDSTDFSLTTTGSISGASVSSVSGSGAAYTVTVTTGSGDGSLRLDIPTAATITDLAGNAVGGLPFTGGESYTVDRSLLTVTINQAPAQTDPAISSPIRFIVIFNKPINPTTFTASDITLGGSAPGTLTVTITEIAPNNGTTFEVVVSGMSGNGTVIASIPVNVVQDLAGNGNTASTSTDNEVTYQPEIRIYLPVIMR